MTAYPRDGQRASRTNSGVAICRNIGLGDDAAEKRTMRRQRVYQ